MAHATAARARLVRADTSGVSALTGILATPIDRAGDLLWRDAEGRGPERLALVRALMARGRFRQALDVANVFDSPASQSYVAYLPVSLTLRAAAADSMGSGGSPYRLRLEALRKSSHD